MEESRGGSGSKAGGLGPLSLCLDFAALYSSLDPRHLQEQAYGCATAEERADVNHNLAIFTQVLGGRKGGASGAEGSTIPHIARQPG